MRPKWRAIDYPREAPVRKMPGRYYWPNRNVLDVSKLPMFLNPCMMSAYNSRAVFFDFSGM